MHTPTRPTWRERTGSQTTLTVDAVDDALYCCAPCGVSQLTQHLRERNFVFRDEELLTLLRRVDGAFVGQNDLPGYGRVTLYSLPGHGLAAP